MSLPSYRNLVLLMCLAGTPVALAQRITYGLKGGLTSMDQTSNSFLGGRDESKRYILGASVEVQLWSGFVLETDFLYRRNGWAQSFSYPPGSPVPSEGTDSPVLLSVRSRAHVFELPVLGKYYFRRDRKVQPFVLTGYSFRKAFVDSESVVTGNRVGATPTRTDHSSNWSSLDVGASFGAGLRWRRGRFSFMPEFRYTRWGGRPEYGVSKQQADFLLGINF